MSFVSINLHGCRPREWKRSISGSYLGLLPTILTCPTWSNSAVVFFCIEPDVGMPLHQAQCYFKQLIDGVVSQSFVHVPHAWVLHQNNIKQVSANYLTSLFRRPFIFGLILGFALFWLRKLEVKSSLVSLNPLSPGIHIQILQTDLHTFP